MLRLLALLSAVFALSACATIDHEKIRASRPLTIGWMGVHYRPDGDHALMLEATDAYGGATSFTTAYDQRRLDALKGKTRTSFAVDAQYVYYPGKTSTFFWGGGVALRRGGGDFLSVPGDDAAPRTGYSVDSAYVSVPLGWTDIFDNKEHATWLNGLTVSFDVGPRARVAQKIRVVGDDAPVKLLEREHTVTFGGGSLLIGFSF